jgi:hypothetical protein
LLIPDQFSEKYIRIFTRDPTKVIPIIIIFGKKVHINCTLLFFTCLQRDV